MVGVDPYEPAHHAVQEDLKLVSRTENHKHKHSKAKKNRSESHSRGHELTMGISPGFSRDPQIWRVGYIPWFTQVYVGSRSNSLSTEWPAETMATKQM